MLTRTTESLDSKRPKKSYGLSHKKPYDNKPLDGYRSANTKDAFVKALLCSKDI